MMARRYEGRKFLRPTVLRGVVAGVVSLAIVVSCVFHTGWGTLSAFGIEQFYLLCPLGALESMLASRSVVLSALISLVLVVVLAVLFGKAFCAWACPVSALSRFLTGKKKRSAQRAEQERSATQVLTRFKELEFSGSCAGCAGCSSSNTKLSCGNAAAAETRLAADAAGGDLATSSAPSGGKRRKRKISFYSRHLILIGALASAFVFGFPVFCLVCPIGLTFGTVVSIVRLVGFNEPSWGLLLFPAIIVVELVVLRKWCHTLCPVSALISLVSSFNRTFRPRVNESECLRTVGESCAVCASVCPENIDPRSDLGARALSECTRCGACVEACPRGALSFTTMKKTPRNKIVIENDRGAPFPADD